MKKDVIIVNGETLEKSEVIKRAESFFEERIVKNHIKNVIKIGSNPKILQINPFLAKYLARFLTGDDSPKSIAKILVYPRALGTSINTTFGSQMQSFINEVLGGKGSLATGMDIEFIDHVDNRRKYCQVKAGPNTINKDDIKTITDHFQGVINLGRTNGVPISSIDCIVGVLYGEEEELSNMYRTINKSYPVYIGKEFWYRLTGDLDFYEDLTDAIGELALKYDGRKILNQVNEQVADYITELDGFEDDQIENAETIEDSESSAHEER